MATMLGSLLVSLGLESAQFTRGSRDAQNSMQTLSKRMKQVGASMQSIGARMSIAVTAPLALFGKTAIDAGVKARESFAQVEQALSTMGNASGKTADQLKASAQELATFSNFNRTDIFGKVTAQLLTFGNVSGAVFDRAQQAAVDLSARLGQDLQSSAIQLGKALNDPIKGITALSRVGVSFTEDQKALIKSLSDSGDVAAAQGVILDELQKQYGGAAKAARDAAPGGDQAQAWRELQEAVGERLVSAFAKLEQIVAPVIRAFLNMPEGVQTAVVVVGALAAAAGPLLVVFGTFISLAPAIAAGFAAVSAAALPIAAVVAAVAAAGYLIYENWDQIAPVLDEVAQGFKDAIGPGLQKAINEISAKLTELWEGPLGDALRAAVGALMEFQVGYMSVLGEGLVRILNAAIAIVGGAFNAILGVLTAVSRFLKGDFAGAWEAMKGVASSVVNAIAGAIESLFPGLIKMGKDIIIGIINGIKAAPGAVRDALISVIKSGVDTVKAFLGIKSPSRLFMAIGHNVVEGLGIGIKNGEGIVSDAMEGLGKEAELQTVRIADTFSQMSQSIVSSLQGMSNSIRSGDFLSILGGVLDTFTTVTGAGGFGSRLGGRMQSASKINKSTLSGLRSTSLPTIPGFAGGTRFAPGGLAVVGERGPELMNVPRGSQIVPNHKLAGLGGMQLNVVPSPYFEVRVQQNIGQAAPALVSAGGQAAQRNMAWRQTRRLR